MTFIQEKVLRYRGAVLRCSPIYGWGWGLNDPQSPSNGFDFYVAESGGDFDVRIRGFIMNRLNECDGLAGEIVEPDHWLSGYWMHATIYAGNNCDLIEHPPFCFRVELCSKKPRVWRKYEEPMFPLCRRIYGQVFPVQLKHDGRVFELERWKGVQPWEQRAMSQFVHLQAQPGDQDELHI